MVMCTQFVGSSIGGSLNIYLMIINNSDTYVHITCHTIHIYMLFKMVCLFSYIYIKNSKGYAMSGL